MTKDLTIIRADLESYLGRDRVRLRVPLAPLTTFQIGGPADLYFRAETGPDLVTAVMRAREIGLPTFLLGRGANILVGDGGFRGLVIHNEVGGIQFLGSRRVRAGAGVLVFPDLIRATVEKGLGGLHHFVGIPSSVGGALWQNLHFLSPPPARERTVFIEEALESADIFTEEGEVAGVDRSYFKFGYDYSILHDRADVVLSATFLLEPSPLDELKRVMRENLLWRKARHPDLVRDPSAGSVFKKVEGVGAGRLIDECGLKGRTYGGAQIFERHANIIVNRGDASASDVMALVRLAQSTVLERTGHALELEITLVGEF